MARRRVTRPADENGGRRRVRAAITAPVTAAARFAEFVEELGVALLDRDAKLMRALLRDPVAGRLPAEVRDEVLAFSRLPATSLRAPVRTLQFIHRMRQLASELDSTLTPGEADQIELFGAPWPGAGEPWSPSPVAAQDSPPWPR